MRVAITGATGFIGRHLTNHLLKAGHQLRAWYRPGSDLGGFVPGDLEWIEGGLNNPESGRLLVRGTDVVIHAALQHTPGRYRGGHDDLLEYLQLNLLGSIALIEQARQSGVSRFLYLSSRAVFDDRVPGLPLDENHPVLPRSHYGAHKAAVEMFIHSFGAGEGYPVCAIRATGVYGLARPIERSKWFGIVEAVAHGKPVSSSRGGTEVHVDDLARTVMCLMEAPGIAGQYFNCSDLYVSDQEVAELAKGITGSSAHIEHFIHNPTNVMVCEKLRDLGVHLGGRALLEQHVQSLLDVIRG